MYSLGTAGLLWIMVWRFGDVNLFKKNNMKSVLISVCIVLFVSSQYYYSDQAWRTSPEWRKNIDKYISTIIKNGEDGELKGPVPFDIISFFPPERYIVSVELLKRHQLSVFSDSCDYHHTR